MKLSLAGDSMCIFDFRDILLTQLFYDYPWGDINDCTRIYEVTRLHADTRELGIQSGIFAQKHLYLQF